MKGANNKNIAKQLLSHLVIQYELKNINMAQDVLICNCNEVYRNEIIKAIEEKGLKTVEEVGEATGAGTICGGCIDDIQAVIDEYYNK